MITWNYRVFLEANGDHIIREAFYDEDGAIIGCTENVVEPSGQSLGELAQDIEWFRQALDLPILTLADIPLDQDLERRQGNGQFVSHEQLLAELGLSPQLAAVEAVH